MTATATTSVTVVQPDRRPGDEIDGALARAFARAAVEADTYALRGLLAADVWFRSLLPRSLVEHHDRDQALETLAGWFGTAVERQVEAMHHRSVGLREHVGWRLRLRPDWAPDTWHLIEQIGYVRIDAGRIRRIDLVCTGFHPQHQV